MKIGFHGAARTVTGSKHLLQLSNGKKYLLDCGMFQGMGPETGELNGHFGFDPTDIAAVIISHAHIDHVGLLPKLVKDGYKGKIYCTPQTKDLAEILLRDSARIQESDVRFVNKRNAKLGKPRIEPLYDEDDVEKVLPMFVTIPYDTPHKVDDNIELLYTDCGHILGSAAVNLKIKDKGREVRLTFSGDVGRYRDMILRSPSPFPQADYLILESTYGNKLHENVVTSADEVLRYITDTCLKRRGRLVIPAFSVGRTQEILYLLNRLEMERRLPPLDYYVDSPLSILATEIIKDHPDCFNKHVQQALNKDEDVFSFKGLRYLRTAEESKALNETKEPCVIISASGMAEAGRIKHHIAHTISSPANTILIVGYCEPRSLGGRLRAGATEVGIFGEKYPVNAEIGVIDSMSAHGDYDDLSQWISCQEPGQVKKLFLVHGEYEVQQEFRERLLRKGFPDIEIPDLHQEIECGER